MPPCFYLSWNAAGDHRRRNWGDCSRGEGGGVNALQTEAESLRINEKGQPLKAAPLRFLCWMVLWAYMPPLIWSSST